MKASIILAILDGFGLRNESNGNAIKLAKTSNFDKIFKKYPFTKLEASGNYVGLPKGQMGNSEVGHTSIGAGKIVLQGLTEIDESIKNGSFFKNEELLEVFKKVKKGKKTLHLMGLISNGGIHSHINHLFAILKFSKEKNINNIKIHAILDGRDTKPVEAIHFIKQIKEFDVGIITTMSGRYYAMDRDNNFDRTQLAYDAVMGKTFNIFNNEIKTVENSYKNKKTDEFFVPAKRKNYEGIKKDDYLIFFNFRSDRAKQISKLFSEKLKKNHLICFTCYDPSLPSKIVFKKEVLKNTLGEILSKNNLKQLRIAETEKYAHVTYFFNGGEHKPFKGENRVLIPSPSVSTYDLKPEMSARKITKKVIENLNNYDVIILNFANLDMVGHTGNLKATIKAVEVIDECIGKIYEEIVKINGVLIITSDHGNAEDMLDKNNKPLTFHTTNPVPFCVVGYDLKLKNLKSLSDITSVILEILKL